MKDKKIDYQGKILQIISWEGAPGIRYESAVRAPGVRVLCEFVECGVKKVLLTREKRRESDGVDYRLPGGKVYNKLSEYNEAIDNNKDIPVTALQKAKEEAKEEAGVVSDNFKLIKKSPAGASVDWDLYYFLATDCTLEEKELSENEVNDMVGHVIVDGTELYKLLLENKIQEGRSAEVLWTWLVNNNYLKLN